MTDQKLTFAADFDPATDQQWRELVEITLKGKPFEKAMQHQSYNDIPIHALYSQSNARIEPQGEIRSGAWDICGPHWNADPKQVNTAILEDLTRGVTSIGLKFESGFYPGLDDANMEAALEGVYLDLAKINLLSGEEFEAIGHLYLDLLTSKGIDAKAAKANLGADPIGTLAQSGRLLTSANVAISKAAELAKRASSEYPTVSTFSVNTSVYHTAGANEVLELSLLIATGLEYLKAMESAGMDLEVAASQIEFNMATDADMYLTIAKFRAARRLWARVLDACGVKNVKMHLGAVSAVRMLSVRDPWVNILRNTTACFSAGVAGADTITILPHDTMLGLPSGFARRIARNIQVICQEESSLAAVSDPAAGSYALETLTTELCEKAWPNFQQLTGEQGGVLNALRTGSLHKTLADTWDKRRANLAKRKDAVTGVSEFPNIHESEIDNVGDAPAFVEMVRPSGEEIEPVAFHRLAEDFEALRDRSDAYLAAHGKRPQIFLANLGAVAEHTARATFAKNFFESGGIEALSNDAFKNTDAMIEAFKASGATAAILCGNDALYAHAEGVAEFLKGVGAKTVYVAGKPANTDSLQEAGVNEFVFMGCNVLEVVERAMNRLGA